VIPLTPTHHRSSFSPACWIAAILLSPGLAAPGSATPIIQEVVYDGPGADADDVFTELYGAPGESLDGWTLVGVNGGDGSDYRTVDLSGALFPDDGILVIATSSAAGEALLQRDFVGSVDWQNGPDAVQLRDPGGAVVDALQYGDAGAFNAGEGAFASTVTAGESLSRNSDGTDTDDNAADFTALTVPSPGEGPAPAPPGGSPAPPPPGSQLLVSVPDTTATYNDTLTIPVRVTDTSNWGIVAVEVFVSFDADLLTPVLTLPANPLGSTGWTVVSNIVEGTGSTIDTLKAVMATDIDTLAGAGTLLEIRLAVADRRVPAASSLTIEHLLFNDGNPVALIEHGELRLVGTDGSLSLAPGEIELPDVVQVTIADADENRDSAVPETLAIRVVEGAQTETLTGLETGDATGIFVTSVAVTAGAAVDSNGVVETVPGHLISFCYDDSLGAEGQTIERCTLAQVKAHDGRLSITLVAQPGDTLRLRLVDRDLNSNPALAETTDVLVVESAASDTEIVALTEISADDSVFVAMLPTASAVGSPQDGVLNLASSESVSATYTDAQTVAGDTTGVSEISSVIDLFGDADANGLLQAFDAARVLAHVLAPALTGGDSLAANVDSLAPLGPITPFDAALILQHRVGLRQRFPVQEEAAMNQPQPESAAPATKPVPMHRLLTLRRYDSYVSVWIDDRSGIVSGDLLLSGISGQVRMPDELASFLFASRTEGDAVRVVFAGDTPVAGGGELVRVYPRGSAANARILKGSFNDDRIAALPLLTSVPDPVPTRFALHPNYPNPFNPRTAIPFDLPREALVRLMVYDIAGQRLRTLLNRYLPAGHHQAIWDGSNDSGNLMGTGVYLFRLEAGSFDQVGRMLLLK